MRTIAIRGTERIVQTNYSPKFGFDSLVKILTNKFEYLSYGKSKTTNSYYIECGQNDYSKSIEVRISDHTKMCSEHVLVLYDCEDTLSLDIVSKEDFLKAKGMIERYLKNNTVV